VIIWYIESDDFEEMDYQENNYIYIRNLKLMHWVRDQEKCDIERQFVIDALSDVIVMYEDAVSIFCFETFISRYTRNDCHVTF